MKLPASGNCLPYPLDNEVFESECLLYIGRGDCYALATMEWLGLNHMHIYMACLYDMIPADKMGKSFGYMNPSHVSPSRVENALKTRITRTQAIANRLAKARPSQFIFIPYNPSAH
ncbi:hypothetical protein AB3S75_042903 [Citrus x aurantiifolia]